MQRAPTRPPGGAHVLFEHFWVEAGPLPVPDGAEGGRPGFVLTPSVAAHLRNLARAALIRRYPVLLQARSRPGVARRPHPAELWGACVTSESASHYQVR
jgi:midasin